MFSSVRVSRGVVCMRDLDRISPGEHRRSGSGHACVQTSFDLSPNLIQTPELQSSSLEQSGKPSSRLRRSTLVFLRQLLTREIRDLAHAAGARSRGVGPARDLVPRGDDAHLASSGRPRRCRSSGRLIGAWRSCTPRRGRRRRESSYSPGRSCEPRACDPRRPS